MPVNDEGVWVPDLNYQQGVAFNCYARYLLLSGPRLAGKCLNSTAIIRANGRLCRIGELGDVKPGESKPTDATILAKSGTAFTQCHASEIYHDPCTDGLSLKTSGGYELEASEWHPVWCFSEGQFGYKTISEISAVGKRGNVWVPIYVGPGEWPSEYIKLDVPVSNATTRKRIAIHRRIAEAAKLVGVASIPALAKAANTSYGTARKWLLEPPLISHNAVTINDDVGYLIGLLLGDGCMTPNTLRMFAGPRFYTCDPVDIIKSIVHKEFGGTMRFCGNYAWGITAPGLTDLIRHLGIDRHGKYKIVPSVIISSPRSVICATLRGLFDSDGSAAKNGSALFATASVRLGRDVQQLLLALGIRSSRFKYRDQAWTVGVYGRDAELFYETVGFAIARKQSRRMKLLAIRHKQRRTAYPPEIRQELKRVYLSRRSRGAPSGTTTRKTHHSGFEHLYGKRTHGISSHILFKAMAFSAAADDGVLNEFYMGGGGCFGKRLHP